MQEFEIIFYEKTKGDEPAKEFLLKLDIKMRAKMVRVSEIEKSKSIQKGLPK